MGCVGNLRSGLGLEEHRCKTFFTFFIPFFIPRFLRFNVFSFLSSFFFIFLNVY